MYIFAPYLSCEVQYLNNFVTYFNWWLGMSIESSYSDWNIILNYVNTLIDDWSHPWNPPTATETCHITYINTVHEELYCW
jgi:hypothetical protein